MFPAWLNIKPSTLYLWAAQGKIPCQKIHGLIRFDRGQAIRMARILRPKTAKVMSTFSRSEIIAPTSISLLKLPNETSILSHGETRPTASPNGKEEDEWGSLNEVTSGG